MHFKHNFKKLNLNNKLSIYALFRSQTTVQKGDSFQLVSCHDEYSLWFDVTKTPPSSSDPICLPSPEPGLHLAMSRTRLGQVILASHWSIVLVISTYRSGQQRDQEQNLHKGHKKAS